MFESLDEVKDYFIKLTDATTEKINKTVNKGLEGKYFALTRNRHSGRKLKYYGKILGTDIYQVGDRDGIWTSILLNYLNKEGKKKSIVLRLDGFNDIRFFDDENTAKLFAELSNQ